MARKYGLFASRRRMAADEQERRDTIGGVDIGLDELLASTADPAEAAAWRDQFESYKELAMSSDELLQRDGLAGLSKMQSEVLAAVDRRKTAQKDFVIEQARDLRGRYQKALEPMRELQSNMGQLNALLSDPEFEQNLPLNRGALLTLLSGTTRQMLSDPADFADAMISAGGGGLISSLVRFAGGALDAQDFDFRREDYAKLARAAYTFNEQRYSKTVAPLELEAGALEQASGSLDFLPPGYSLTRYVTGSPETFENPLKPDYGDGGAARVTNVDRAQETAADFFRSIGVTEEEPNADRAAAGPQFGGIERPDMTGLDRVLGWETEVRTFNQKLQELQEGGATLRTDPNTGAVYAVYDDGRRDEVETSRPLRAMVKRGLGKGGAAVSGVIRR